MQSTTLNIYLQNSVNTATPAQLLLMLYDGAIRFCKQGIQALENKDFKTANDHLCRVQDIVQELLVTLDKKSELAKTLVPLYNYMYGQLLEANLKKAPEPAREVLGYLNELRDAFHQASRQLLQAGQVRFNG
jgi:flagellar protein FliS